MPKTEYKHLQFHDKTRRTIETANGIIEEYQQAGYSLTLRQLYYQFVARGLIPNSDKEYGNLGTIINNGRLAGLIDWNAIVDRTRTLRKNSHFDNPQDILKTAADSYRINTRATQDYYLEVWVEKDALIGVVEPICSSLDVPCFSCRGYVSQSAMWLAAQRINTEACWGSEEKYIEKGLRKTIVIHLGDHDPSGVHMSIDIQNRLKMFLASTTKVLRIALTMAQVKKFQPPPNPAKLTDTRSRTYIEQYGDLSWELDALDPKVLSSLIEKTVKKYTDEDKREKLLDQQTFEKSQLRYVSDNWKDLDIEVE